MSLQGKRALITGASRGIGRGIALELARRGVHVAVNYLKNETAAFDTVAAIKKLGVNSVALQADVAQPDNVRELVQSAHQRLGGLDIFVSNARTDVGTFFQPPMQITLAQWDTALDSQAKAFLVAVRAAAEVMPDNGRIVAITYAPGGRFGSWQSWVGMGAAKSALEVLCRYFAVALAPRGITVNAISPGWVEDSVLNTLPDTVVNMVRDWQKAGWTPMGRLGMPADIGKAVALLCSEDAAWITGQTIDVDGGASLMSAHMPLELQVPDRSASPAKSERAEPRVKI